LIHVEKGCSFRAVDRLEHRALGGEGTGAGGSTTPIMLVIAHDSPEACDEAKELGTAGAPAESCGVGRH
jgi:hypothetical protein